MSSWQYSFVADFEGLLWTDRGFNQNTPWCDPYTVTAHTYEWLSEAYRVCLHLSWHAEMSPVMPRLCRSVAQLQGSWGPVSNEIRSDRSPRMEPNWIMVHGTRKYYDCYYTACQPWGSKRKACDLLTETGMTACWSCLFVTVRHTQPLTAAARWEQEINYLSIARFDIFAALIAWCHFFL